MDTVINLKYYGKDANKAADESVKRISYVVNLM